MAEINLGDFPFYSGVKLEEKSIYIGNNRFFKIASQRDNDSIIGVIYESTDVFDNAQTVTQVCSEVLFAGQAMNNIKMTILGNGDIAVIGKLYPNTAYYTFTVTYDDVNNTFTKGSITYLSNSDLNGCSGNTIVVQPYGQTTAFVVGTDPNTSGHLFRIEYDPSITCTTEHSYPNTNLFDSPYYYAAGLKIRIVEDLLYFRLTPYSYGYEYVYNIATETMDSGSNSHYPDVCKLAENKYVVVQYDNNNADLVYNLSTTLPDRANIGSSSYSSFIPSVRSVGTVNANVGRILETFQLDDQHMIIFDKAGDTDGVEKDNVYARVVKVVDDNYAFISDNSTSTNGVLITSNYNGAYPTMSSFYNGVLINRVDSQRFYIRTNQNTFEFFTLTV